jgi:mitogen-activated protein kinase 1/3
MSILRQLSSMKGNVFTTKLYDVIVSEEALKDIPSMTHVFFVMELVELDIKSLFHLGTGGDFNSHHATVLMYNLLCSIKFIHSAGIIHRDIKPANILIDSNCVVKICDFGLSTVELKSKGISKRNVMDYKTVDHFIVDQKQQDQKPQKAPRKLSPAVQTRFYRSPEVILLEDTYDTQIDMWSLGCIFFELVNF